VSFETQLQCINALKVRFLICLVGVLLAATSYGQTAASVDACGSGGEINGPDGNPHRPYQERTIFTSAQAERKWLIRIPKGYQEGTRADVLFNFHGAGSKAETAATYANFDEQADRDGVILVMPDANKLYVDQSHELARYWNRAWEGKFRTRDYDVNFVLELVDLIRTEYCTGEFYAAGMSAGGDITTALQCRNESPFEAFAPVTYRYYLEDDCKGAPPYPMISFHGTDDRVVPFSGLDEPWFDPPVDVIMQSWASHNGCDGEAAQERVGRDVIRYRWNGCDAPVEWYLIEGGGHTWPGTRTSSQPGHASSEISASDKIWEFFFR
jgi:polyhydroxybutyrate depolymerase